VTKADKLARLRILHLPDLVGGHPTALCAGERSLGAISKTLSLNPSPFGYESDVGLQHQNGNVLQRWSERVSTFARIRNRFDVFHFNFGSSLFNAQSGKLVLADLPLYPAKALKIMTYQGSDARHSYGEYFQESLAEEYRLGNGEVLDAFMASHKKMLPVRQAAIEKASRYCAHLFALNPDLLDELPSKRKSFLPFAINDVGSLRDEISIENFKAPAKVHIVHLSTNRLLKGTGLIENVLKKLSKDLPITFEILFREERSKALQALQRADLVIDQLVLGWYGAAAVEAMYFGKPVIGYIDEKQLVQVPAEMARDLPLIQSTTYTLEERISDMINDSETLQNLGSAALGFAKKWHSPEKIAQLTLKTYMNNLK